jgi:predicted nucleic acid-binding protein
MALPSPICAIPSADEQAFLVACHTSTLKKQLPPWSLFVMEPAAAMRYGLTAYDAAYVDLASRERLTLATLDAAIRKAARDGRNP